MNSAATSALLPALNTPNPERTITAGATLPRVSFSQVNSMATGALPPPGKFQSSKGSEKVELLCIMKYPHSGSAYNTETIFHRQ